MRPASPEIQALLEAYRSGRDVLLECTRQILEQDERLSAAWLFGSLGRDEADALSDLDLFVIIADAHLDEIVSQRQTYVKQVGKPVLMHEAPQNAPPGGAYLMTFYPGQLGPYAIDWYWQAQSVARIPAQTLLLFDRVGFPRLDTPPHFDYQPTPERTPEEAATQTLNFFWAMLLITAKYVARSPHEAKMGLLGYALNALREIERFVDAEETGEGEPHPLPSEKLAILRALAARMEALMPQVAARGGRIPLEIVPQVRLYLNLIEQISP